MKNLIKYAVGGALAIAATSANAVTAPSNATTGGSLTLQLFSTADSTPFSYSFDTGITYSTLGTLPTAPGTHVTFALTGLAGDLAANAAATPNLVFDVVSAWNKGGSIATKAGVYNLATTFDPGVTSAQITALDTNNGIIGAYNADFAWLNNDFGGTNPSFTNSTSALNYANTNFNAELNTFGVAAASGTGNVLPFYTMASAKGVGTTPGQAAVTLAGDWTINLTNDTLTYSVPGGGPPPVPLPAGLWLLASGLAGLAGIGRRRAQAA